MTGALRSTAPMTNWFSEEEGAQLRFEFEAELVRLDAA